MTSPAARLRHLHAPRPIVFPTSLKVPEKRRHFAMRVHLFSALHRAFEHLHTIGSDQFVYWNARDPRRCLAPDVFVQAGIPDSDIDSWKTWERSGPPHLGVEIVSDSDSSEMKWAEKFERYHELGVRELVRFDADEPSGSRLRVWDRLDDDLVERAVEDDVTECVTLGTTWRVGPVKEYPHGLRVWLRDELLLDGDEAADVAETARAEAETARTKAETARAEAERRIAELEAALATKK